MDITKISDQSLQVTRLKLMNCYLIRESDGYTLIDTTIKGAAEDILKAAGEVPIKRILLTHAHVDHIGAVDELAARLGAVDVAISERSLPLIQQPPDKSLRPGEPAGEIKGGLPGMATRPTHMIADGELYGSLRAIATPGHIPGHFAFLDERDGTLYAGDALIGVGKLAVSGFAPWYFPFPNMATWNKPTAAASARRLLEFPIERFACGHGAVREGGVVLLKKVVEAASR